MDDVGYYPNNTAFFLPINDPWIVAVLNSPIAWWYAWRTAQHGKDEALRFLISFVEAFPIPEHPEPKNRVEAIVQEIRMRKQKTQEACETLHNWLRTQFEITRISRELQEPFEMNADQFVRAVSRVVRGRAALKTSAVRSLHEAYEETLRPAQRQRQEMQRLERELSSLVNAAYGLTEEEVALMWRTAPPRMPVNSPS